MLVLEGSKSMITTLSQLSFQFFELFNPPQLLCLSLLLTEGRAGAASLSSQPSISQILILGPFTSHLLQPTATERSYLNEAVCICSKSGEGQSDEACKLPLQTLFPVQAQSSWLISA